MCGCLLLKCCACHGFKLWPCLLLKYCVCDGVVSCQSTAPAGLKLLKYWACRFKRSVEYVLLRRISLWGSVLTLREAVNKLQTLWNNLVSQFQGKPKTTKNQTKSKSPERQQTNTERSRSHNQEHPHQKSQVCLGHGGRTFQKVSHLQKFLKLPKSLGVHSVEDYINPQTSHSFVVRPMWFSELLAAVPSREGTALRVQTKSPAEPPVQTERPIERAVSVKTSSNSASRGIKNDCNTAHTVQALLEEHRHHTVYAVKGCKVDK